MTLKSLYEFFKVYFSYQTSGNREYAKSISAAVKIIGEAVSQKSVKPIQKYLHYAYSRSVTKDMLLNLVYLSMKYYEEPFNEIEYFKTTALIDKSLITTNHRGINVPIEGGYDRKNNKLIILTFSKPSNMENEVSVIKGLVKEFTKPDTWSISVKTVVYWNLSNRQAYEVDFTSLLPVDRQSLIDAANRVK